jgi:hypothetical protein
MPYILQSWRDIVDPLIKDVLIKANNEGNVTIQRMAKMVQTLLVCVYQEEAPNTGSGLPIDTMIMRDLVQCIVHKFEPEQRWGTLNYCVCRLIFKTVLSDGIRYNKLQAVMEILETARLEVHERPLRALLRCVEHEFYDRLARNYEDCKIEENGDVF